MGNETTLIIPQGLAHPEAFASSVETGLWDAATATTVSLLEAHLESQGAGDQHFSTLVEKYTRAVERKDSRAEAALRIQMADWIRTNAIRLNTILAKMISRWKGIPRFASAQTIHHQAERMLAERVLRLDTNGNVHEETSLRTKPDGGDTNKGSTLEDESRLSDAQIRTIVGPLIEQMIEDDSIVPRYMRKGLRQNNIDVIEKQALWHLAKAKEIGLKMNTAQAARMAIEYWIRCNTGDETLVLYHQGTTRQSRADHIQLCHIEEGMKVTSKQKLYTVYEIFPDGTLAVLDLDTNQILYGVDSTLFIPRYRIEF